jgi:hypothetical protein
MIKIQDFQFDTPSETALTDYPAGCLVRFAVSDTAQAIRFLTSLDSFVQAYNAGHTVPTELQVVSEPAPVAAPKAPAARAPRKPAVQPPVQVQAAPVEGEPEVTESVVAPLDPKAGSAPAVETASAASSPAPAAREAVVRAPAATAPKAPTGPSAAPSAAASASTAPSAPDVAALPADQVPAELMAAKSFRAAVLFLVKAGHNTQETLTHAIRQYAAVPCLARYLAPNPDPEMAIEKRVARALEVLSTETAA